MTTPQAPAASSQQPNSPPAKSGVNVRLIVLLGVLGVVVAMLLVDLLVFKPAAIKAQEDLSAAAEEKMRSGVGEEGSKGQQHFFTAADVERVVGRSASWEKQNPKGDHVIQTFAWWGKFPLNRHRFDVLYRKSNDGTLIYESHDGSLEFTEIEDVKVAPAELPIRTNDPVANEGSGTSPDGLDNTTPVVPPTDNPPADAGTTSEEAKTKTEDSTEADDSKSEPEETPTSEEPNS